MVRETGEQREVSWGLGRRRGCPEAKVREHGAGEGQSLEFRSWVSGVSVGQMLGYRSDHATGRYGSGGGE